MLRPRWCARVARPILLARRSRISASPSAPRVIRGGLAGRSGSRPQGGWKNSAAGMRGTPRTPKHDTARLGVTRSPDTQDPTVWRTRQRAYPSHGSAAERSVTAHRGADLRQDGSRKEHTMPHTPHDFLDEARRTISEVSVEDVAARRTHGDDFILLDVREKDEVRAGYIEGAITIPRGFLEFQASGQLPQTDTDVVVYCASWARSLLAAQVLHAMGYTRIASMAGGITRWREAGYPVV